MKLITLSIEEAKQIYDTRMQEDFPQDELKPWNNILRMWQDGGYRVYGVIDGLDDLLAYAFCSFRPGGRAMLLDYLAVSKANRGQGIGSWILQELKDRVENMDVILIETEDIDYATTEAEKQERIRRDHFYEENGVKLTSVKGCVYGIHYVVWQLIIQHALDDKDCNETYIDIYDFMLGSEKLAFNFSSTT